MTSLEDAARKIHKALYDEGPVPGYHKGLHSQHRKEWPTLHNALDELVTAVISQPSAAPPKDTWYLLVDDDFVNRRKHVYLMRDNTDGTRDAYIGTDTFQTLAEGAAAPVWLTMTHEAYEESALVDAFKHVYTIEQRFRRIYT